MKKNYKSYSIFIKNINPLFNVIDEYAFLCKNLKNAVLYHYRQFYFKENKTPKDSNVITEFTKIKQSDYYAIPTKVSQQVILQVGREFQSFWSLVKAYHKDKSKQRPNIPKYLHKTKGRANVIFTKQTISKPDVRKGILTLSKKIVPFQFH